MVITYRKLWKLMEQGGMTKRDLIRVSGISYTTVRNMEKGNNVNLDVLRRICEALHVGLGDVVELVDEQEPKRWEEP